MKKRGNRMVYNGVNGRCKESVGKGSQSGITEIT